MALILKIWALHVNNTLVTQGKLMQTEMDSFIFLGLAKNDGILLSNLNRPELRPEEKRWSPACDWFPG